MGNIELSKAASVGDSNVVESIIKKPKDVANFLREEYNFGDPKESDRMVLARFIQYVKVRGNEKSLLNEPTWADLIADELEKAGFAKPGYLSHETWTSKHEEALNEVLESL